MVILKHEYDPILLLKKEENEWIYPFDYCR